MSTKYEPRPMAVKDMWLASSNNPPASVKEFEERALYFPKGTVFNDYGAGDREDKYSLHGWCFKRPGEESWAYCNMHAYILDKWQAHSELFNYED